jgi:Family of unknown function (DUF6318)
VSEGLGVSTRHNIAMSIAAALLLGAGLAGCDGDNGDGPYDSGLPSDDESTTATTPASTEPTATDDPSTPATPTIPTAATKSGRAGAKAFVEFYIDLENYAKDTGDVAPLRQYSHPECGGCGDIIRFYREWYERGGWFRDGDRTVASFDRVALSVAPHDMYVRISGVQKAGAERERRDASVRRVGREPYTLLLWLLRDLDGWRVSRLDVP